MSVQHTPVMFDVIRPSHCTKKSRQMRNEKRPPKLKRRHMKPSKTLFHDASSISFLKTEDGSLSLSKLHKHSDYLTYFRQNFDNIWKIGEGSFGEVFKARCIKTGQYFAVKKSKEPFRSEYDRKSKLEEVQKHELIPQHENCVQFFNAWEEDDYLYIQLELCQESLEEYTQVNHEITNSMLWEILLDMLLAVKHLHDRNLLHLDIKLENILIALNGHFKLGDFGLVVDISSEKIKDAVEGDAKYLAPELMTGHFTKAADMFSLGITMLELASDLDLPSGGPLWHELRNGIFPEEYTKNICPELFNIIKGIMAPDYVERPTVDDVLSHPCLRKMMMKRQRLHYIKQVMGEIQHLYQRGWRALRTVADVLFLPLGILHNRRVRCITTGSDTSISNSSSIDENSAGSLAIDFSLSDEEIPRNRSHTPENTTGNLTHLFSNMSPIRGEKQMLDISVPTILITNSTPRNAPPCTPKKRNLDSLQEAVTPLHSMKRICTSVETFNLHRRRLDMEAEDACELPFSSTPTGARNLLPLFGCSDS